MQHAIAELGIFQQSSALQKAMVGLERAGFGKGDEFERTRNAVGIKKLLSIVEMVRQGSDDIPERLVGAIMGSDI